MLRLCIFLSLIDWLLGGCRQRGCPFFILQLHFYYSLLVLTRKLPSLLSAGAAAAAAPFIGAGASNWQQFPALGGSGSAVERKRRQK
jgi:hypothetical protein